MAARAQPYRLEWPWTALAVEQLDEMLQILFDDLRNGNLTIEATQIEGLTSYDIGDILYADAADSLTTLPIGGAGQVLQVNDDATAPEWGLVAFENMEPAASASTLIGRQSGSSGDWEAITLGSGLTMTGTTLDATGGGFPDATYLTEDDETGDLPNSRRLLAGTNITFDDATPGERTISATGGGSWIPAVDGSEPPNFITDGAGVLILVAGP
jgi:hypothetical protein